MNEIAGALAQRCEFTMTGLRINAQLSLEEVQNLTQLVTEMQDRSRWWLADAINYGEQHYGDMYTQWTDALGLDYGHLRNVAWVGRSFPLERRRSDLSFSHHRRVAPLEPDQQDWWLDECAKWNWSSEELRRRIRNPPICPTTGEIDNSLPVQAPEKPSFTVNWHYKNRRPPQAGWYLCWYPDDHWQPGASQLQLSEWNGERWIYAPRPPEWWTAIPRPPRKPPANLP